MDPIGASAREKIELAIFEPILLGILKELETDGRAVNLTHDEAGYLILIGTPDKSQYTVAGKTAKETLSDLFRNLRQSGVLPRELREMQLQIEQQMRPIRDAISTLLDEDQISGAQEN